MDEPREMPRMCVEGDFLSIYECAECGAVVRDPDTHIGWHARRRLINQRDFCDIPGCDKEQSWTIPALAMGRDGFVVCDGHMADLVRVARANFVANSAWKVDEEARRG